MIALPLRSCLATRLSSLISLTPQLHTAHSPPYQMHLDSPAQYSPVPLLPYSTQRYPTLTGSSLFLKPLPVLFSIPFFLLFSVTGNLRFKRATHSSELC